MRRVIERIARLLVRQSVRVVKHEEPFDFTGIDRISILEGPVSAATRIPFSSVRTRTWIERYDAKRHFTMDGRVPDTIHRFIRPNGVPLDFLIRDGRIIQVNDNVAAYRS
jgi:hypothetical protein